LNHVIVIDGLHASCLFCMIPAYNLNYIYRILKSVDCQIVGRQSNIRICSFWGSSCCSHGLGSETKKLEKLVKSRNWIV